MGLFNSGKTEKVDKIEKYEEHHESSSPKKKSHHSSKHPKHGPIIRPMPQSSFIPNFGYQQMKYPFSSNFNFDLSRLTPSAPNPYQQFYPNQFFSPNNFNPLLSNPYQFYTDRSPYQQQNPWSYAPQSNNNYMQPMNF